MAIGLFEMQPKSQPKPFFSNYILIINTLYAGV